MAAHHILINIPQLYGRPAPFLQRLRDAGYTLVMNDTGALLTEDELIRRLAGVYATMAGGEHYTECVFASAPELRVVARFGVGWDRVDVAAATRHDVAVAMGFGSNHESVADYAFAMILALGVDLLPHHAKAAAGGWGTNFHPGIWGRTLGVVGLGRIGRAVARRARGFRMRVIGCDSNPEMAAAAHADGVEAMAIDTVLAEADFVSLHTPFTPDNRKMMGEAQFAAMKPTAFFVNTARGELVDEAALHAALTQGVIAGAGIDAFDAEPPVGSALLALDNVVLAPHAASMDEAAERLMADACIDNILTLRDGSTPIENRLLNPEVLNAWRTAGEI